MENNSGAAQRVNPVVSTFQGEELQREKNDFKNSIKLDLQTMSLQIVPCTNISILNPRPTIMKFKNIEKNQQPKSFQKDSGALVKKFVSEWIWTSHLNLANLKKKKGTIQNSDG